MKALVTGAAGFIGSHLVEALVREGAQVRCLVRPTTNRRWLQGLPVEWVYGDCRNPHSLVPVVQGVDQVFHLAGATRANTDAEFFEINATGTENLVRVCAEHNPRLTKFVLLSSQAAAGPGRPGMAKTETEPCEPISPYGRSKRRGEELALAFRNRVNLVILRPCAVYGPRDPDVLIIFQLAARRIKFHIAGLDQRISLCYADDVVDAVIRAGRSECPSGEIFFVADGREYSLRQIGDIFSNALGKKALRFPVPTRVIMALAWCAEAASRLTGKTCPLTKNKAKELVQANWVCDITKARATLGYNPRYDLKSGSRFTVEWYRKEKWL